MCSTHRRSGRSGPPWPLHVPRRRARDAAELWVLAGGAALSAMWTLLVVLV